MKKQILIIGGGISGLAVLHFLKKKFVERRDLHIRLLEKNPYVGGTIGTQRRANFLFENGPNGFLGSQDLTFQLINDLNLKNELLMSNRQSRIRYIAIQNKLHEFPNNPLSLLRFRPLSIIDKFRMICEIFIGKSSEESNESIFDFAERRLGRNCTKFLIDPMVSGIFGGDAKVLHMKSSFPKIFEIEQTYGSITGGIFKLKKHKNSSGEYSSKILYSLREGMGQLIKQLSAQHHNSIFYDETVKNIGYTGEGFMIETNKIKYFADILFLCTPAYTSAQIVKELNSSLSLALENIPYASLAVIGLGYRLTAFEKFPEGFGYLYPSSEGGGILGVLFCSNIFPDRALGNHVMVRLMLGGIRHPEVVSLSENELFDIAIQEMETVMGAKKDPIEKFIKVWPEAIPQYHMDYPNVRKQIENSKAQYPNLHLAANYLDGISLNDCVKNAYSIVEKLEI